VRRVREFTNGSCPCAALPQAEIFFTKFFFQNFFYTIHERLVSLRGAAAGRNTRKSVYTALIIVKRYHTDFSEFV